MRVKDYNGRNTSITRGTVAWFLKDETEAQFGDLFAQRYLILIRSGKSSDSCWTLALQHSSFCTPAYWIGRIVHDTENVGEKKWNDINANEIPSSGLLEHLLKLPVKLLCWRPQHFKKRKLFRAKLGCTWCITMGRKRYYWTLFQMGAGPRLPLGMVDGSAGNPNFSKGNSLWFPKLSF